MWRWGPPSPQPGYRIGLWAVAPALALLSASLRRQGFLLDALAAATLGLLAALAAGMLLRGRRRSETETVEGERRYRHLVENGLGLICTHDLNGNLLSVNPAAAELLGYQPEDGIGRNLRGFLAPQVRHLFDDYLLRIREKGSDSGSMFLVTRDGGELVWMYRNVLWQEEGKPAYVLGHAVDVTELIRARKALKEAQEELERRVAERTSELERANERLHTEAAERQRAEEERRKSEERFRAAFSGTAIGMALNDVEGRFLEVNDACCTITGYTKEEMLGRDFQSITHPEDLPENLSLQKRVLTGEIPGFVWEKRYVHKSGRSVWVRFSVSPLKGTPGDPARFVTMCQDVTARKRLEEQLLQSQKMEAIGRLAGGVAHDFNNLLTVITGYAQMLSSELSPSDPLRECAAAVLTAAERASVLTRQLLALGRRQVLQQKVLNVNVVLAQTESMLRRVIGEDTELVIVLSAQLGQVKADRGQMEQVILNLAINARDAMPRGGRLTIETANIQVDEAAASAAAIVPGPYVTLTVTDTGSGMSAETQSHLFEPFFTTKEQGKGTGLGLSTVYGIIKQSGGHVEVESTPGQGSTFRICLPRAEEAAAEDQEEELSQPERGEGTVLLVEDEPEVRKLAQDLLTRTGYTVIATAEAQDALRQCEERREPIDLLLADVVLPQMSGWELAEKVTKLRPGIRVLLMSGYSQDALGEQSVPPSPAAFIQKPFTGAALARKVREALKPRPGRSAGA